MKQLVQAPKGKGYSLSGQGIYVAHKPCVVTKTAVVSTGVHYDNLELLVDELPDNFSAESFDKKYAKDPKLALAYAKQQSGKKEVEIEPVVKKEPPKEPVVKVEKKEFVKAKKKEFVKADKPLSFEGKPSVTKTEDK